MCPRIFIIVNRLSVAGAVLQTPLSSFSSKSPNHFPAQTETAREMPCHVSHVTRHASHGTYHMSCVIFFYLKKTFLNKLFKLVGEGSAINWAYFVQDIWRSTNFNRAYMIGSYYWEFSLLECRKSIQKAHSLIFVLKNIKVFSFSFL